MGGVAKRIGAAAALAGLVSLGVGAGVGAQTAQEGGSVKPMPSTTAPQGGSSAQPGGATPAPAQQSAGPTAELAPGIIFEVVELRRMPERGFMQLRFAVNNTTSADTSLKQHGLAYDGYLKDIVVIDFGGRRQYTIGSASQCLCSNFRDRDGGVVRAGQRREFWAWYGLPAAGARQMGIQLPELPPIMDVPLL
ncbi:MAG: hypothetical protein ICV73_12710 [Acetobacteraceae bacterium]|nr:hypothetical protein [Acetobacteraceae bacterium]